MLWNTCSICKENYGLFKKTCPYCEWRKHLRFNYQDKVEIIFGFYKGYTGEVIELVDDEVIGGRYKINLVVGKEVVVDSKHLRRSK